MIVAAVGRLRWPEAAMTADYLQRATQAGRQIGFKASISSKPKAPPGDMRAGKRRFFRATPMTRKILLDERGPSGPRANSLKSSRAGATMALPARRSGSAAPMALHRALRITLTKSSLLADKRGPTGSFAS